MLARSYYHGSIRGAALFGSDGYVTATSPNSRGAVSYNYDLSLQAFEFTQLTQVQFCSCAWEAGRGFVRRSLGPSRALSPHEPEHEPPTLEKGARALQLTMVKSRSSQGGLEWVKFRVGLYTCFGIPPGNSECLA